MWFSNRRAKWRRHEQLGLNRQNPQEGDQDPHLKSLKSHSPYSEEEEEEGRLTPVDEDATSLQNFCPSIASKSPSSDSTLGVEPLHHQSEEGVLNLSTRASSTPASTLTTTPDQQSVLQQQHHPHQPFFVRSPQLMTPTLLPSPPQQGNLSSSRPSPPGLLPVNSLLSRSPLHLTSDLTLTPLSQFGSLTQLTKQQALSHAQVLSHAHALTIMSNLHLAQQQQQGMVDAVGKLPGSCTLMDENVDSDIDVTDSEEKLGVSANSSDEADNLQENKRMFEEVVRESATALEEVQDLSVKKRKFDLTTNEMKELKIDETNPEDRKLLTKNILVSICKNSAQTECN